MRIFLPALLAITGLWLAQDAASFQQGLIMAVLPMGAALAMLVLQSE